MGTKAKHLFKMFTYRLLIVALSGRLECRLHQENVGNQMPHRHNQRRPYCCFQYLEIWYEIPNLPNIFQGNMNCVTADYTPRGNSNVNAIKSIRIKLWFISLMI